MFRLSMYTVLFVASVLAADAGAQTSREPSREPSRGELLYSTHCIACHTTQMHWRQNKTATDWNTLRSEVRRWQANNALSWNDDDITEVVRYLNDLIYRYAVPG